MSIQEQGMGLAAAADDAPTAASRTRDGSTAKLPLRVENLGIAAPPAHVKFSYTVAVSGMLERIVRSTSQGGPSILIVDGAAHLVPADTLVIIETGEIR